MNKEFALELLMLLSAIESWSFADRKPIPDYLHERLSLVVGRLKDEVLNARS